MPKYPVPRLGMVASLGLAGSSTRAAAVLRPVAPHGCQQRGGLPWRRHCHLTGGHGDPEGYGKGLSDTQDPLESSE